jgi:hypothetical protein
VANHDRNPGDGHNLAQARDLAEIERRTVELLAQPTRPSRHATRPTVGLAANGCAAFPETTSPRHRHTQKIPPGGNLVRIVRTFKPFPEPILLPGEAGAFSPGLKSVYENSISKLSPEGTAELSPGRQSWVHHET